MIKEGFKNIFASQREIELVALASNGKEAIEITSKQGLDVIIMDVRMPVMGGNEACHHIHSQYPQIKVIAFSMSDDEESLIQMRMAGACGYLLKNTDTKEIYSAIRVVHEGGEYYSLAVRSRMDHLYREGKLGPAITEKKQLFSSIELKIINLICDELSSKEIADILQLNRRTIEHHKERIQEKMGVHSSVGIAVFALSNWLRN